MADRRPGRGGARAAAATTVAWLLPLVALGLALPALWRASPPIGSATDDEPLRRALAEGNRLVRAGDPEAAVEVYTAAWSDDASGAVAGVLAYNLGTTLHRLDRRPEALLWYLRSRPLRPGDRWLEDNLALVRRELAAPRRPPPGPAAAIAARRETIGLAAVVAAWAALALRVAARRSAGRRRSVAGAAGWILAVGALLLWLVATTIAPRAPRPAVLLAACGDATPRDDGFAAADRPSSHRLPAGTEVWARPAAGGTWSLADAQPADCPADAVAVP